MTNVEIAERYRQLYAGVVYDAMVFDWNISDAECVVWSGIARRSGGAKPLVGPAMTCEGRTVARREDVNDTIRLDMLEAMTPGCVQVISALSTAVAHFGDISALLARTRGCVGVVTDGYSRDIDLLREGKFSLFCRGIKPQDAFGRWQITGHSNPVMLPGDAGGSIWVRPGDWIFADGDGVLVIPCEKVMEVLTAAERRKEGETVIRSAVLKGEPPRDIHTRLGRW